MQIGVDFGGTKIEVAALDRHGELIIRRRKPNPGCYERSIEVICQLVFELEAELGRTGTVGIGVPGSISRRTQKMRNANSVWLNGMPFPGDLSAALNRDIRIANDANCLALSEATGAMAGAKVGYAIVLGTGCGGGLTINGDIIEGANGIGGEWGHTPLPWKTNEELKHPSKCWCGKEHCLETWISGPGVSRDYQQATGNSLTAIEIMKAAGAGDNEAKAALDRFLDRLGRAIAVVSNIIDPDIFVLGGGLSNVPIIYEAVPDIVTRYVFSDGWCSKILPAKWGDSSGVRGAAQLWPVESVRDSAIEKRIENIVEVSS